MPRMSGHKNHNEDIALRLFFKNPSVTAELDDLADIEHLISRKTLYGKDYVELECGLDGYVKVQISFKDGFLKIITSDDVDILLSGQMPINALHIKTGGSCSLFEAPPLNPNTYIFIEAKFIILDTPLPQVNFLALLTDSNSDNSINIKQPIVANKLLLNTNDLVLNAELKSAKSSIVCNRIDSAKTSNLSLGVLPVVSEENKTHPFVKTHDALIQLINDLQKSILETSELLIEGSITFVNTTINDVKTLKFMPESNGVFLGTELNAKEVYVSEKVELTGSSSSFKGDYAQIDGAVTIDNLVFNMRNINVPENGILDGITQLILDFDQLGVVGIVRSRKTFAKGDSAIAWCGGTIIGSDILDFKTAITGALFGGQLVGDNLYNRTGTYVNAFGIIDALNKSFGSVVNLEFGPIIRPVDINNPLEVIDLIERKIQLFGEATPTSMEELYNLLPKDAEDIWQTVSTHFGEIRILLNKVSPRAEIVATLSYQSINLLKLLLRIYDQYKKGALKSLRGKPYHEVVAIILDLKSVVTNAASLKNSITQAQLDTTGPEAIEQKGQTQESSNKANDASTKTVDVPSLLTDLASLWLPSHNSDSILFASAPLVSMGWSFSDQNWLSVRGGFNIAWNQYEQTAFNQYDHSIRYAHNLILTSGKRYHYGQAKVANLLLNANQIYVSRDGIFRATKSTRAVISDDFISHGTTDFTNGNFLVGGRSIFSETAHMRTNDMHMRFSDGIVHNGSTQYAGALSLETSNICTSPTSTINAEDDSAHYYLSAETAQLQGAEQHSRVIYKIKGMPIIEAVDLFNGSGKHANKIVKESIHVISESAGNAVLNQLGRGSNVEQALTITDDITIDGSLEAESLALKSTAGSIDQKKDLKAQQDISLEAAKKITKPSVTTQSAQGNVSLQAGDMLDNSHGGKVLAPKGVANVVGGIVDNDTHDLARRSTIEAQSTFVQSITGDIKNRGSSMRGDRFIAVYSASNIENIPFETRVWRGHDCSTIFHGGEIIGGIGNDTSDGFGAVVDARGIVNNYASTIGSGAHTYVHGALGIKHKVAHSVYKAEDTKERHTLYKIYRTADGVQWGAATIYGVQNTLGSSEGGMHIYGGNTQAPLGSTVWSKGQHVSQSAVVTLKKKKVKEYRVRRSTRKETHEQECNSVFQTVSGPIEIVSLEAGIQSTGSVYLGLAAARPKLIFRAKGDISINARILDHSITHHIFGGISLSIAGQSIFGSNHKCTWVDRLAAYDQTAASMRDFANSNNPVDALINGYSVMGGLNNLAGSIAQDGLGGTIAKRTGVSVGITNSKTALKYQTLGDGSIIFFDEIIFDSAQGNVNVGVDIDHVRRLYVHADTFRAHGTGLNSSMRHHAETVTGTMSFTGAMDASASISFAQSTTKSFTQNKIRVGILDIEAKIMELSGSDIYAEQTTGEVGTLVTKPLIGSTRSKQQSFGASYSGNVSASVSSSSRETYDARGVLRAANPDGMQMKIDKHIEHGEPGIVDDGEGKTLELAGTSKEHHDVSLRTANAGASAATNLLAIGDPKEGNSIQFGLDTRTQENTITTEGLQRGSVEGNKFNFVQYLPKAAEPRRKQEDTQPDRTGNNTSNTASRDLDEAETFSDPLADIFAAAEERKPRKLRGEEYSNTPIEEFSPIPPQTRVDDANRKPKPSARKTSFEEHDILDDKFLATPGFKHGASHNVQAGSDTWYEPSWIGKDISNLNIAGKFTIGVASGMAVNGAIFKASSIKYLGSFIRGAGWLGAGVMVAEAFGVAAEFERDNFMYTEEYEHIVNNPLISADRKDQLFDESIKRQAQARKEAEHLKDLVSRFKENPAIFGFGVGSFLTIEQLPRTTFAANAFLNLRIRFPFKSIANDRHVEYLSKVVKAPVGIEHIEFVTGGANGFENFSNARTMAAIRANLGEGAVPYLAEVGPQRGNVYVGVGTPDKNCLWRLDLNTRVPIGTPPIPHINWQYYDFNSGKRYYGAINIDMTLHEYCQIINKFPRKLPFIAPIPGL